MTLSTMLIHQTVHGYRAGHQLLQTSRPLPNDVQRRMLVQSDLSGPSLVPGFDDYVTGYPLEEIGAYVVARTWNAPEMDRPGCVWTHSLLVEFADLAQLEDLSALVKYFRRPSGGLVLADPAVAAIAVDTLSEGAAQSYDRATAARILGALYSRPESPVVVLRRDSAELEDTVLAIWSQQWPRLRRNFRFCTGALSVAPHESIQFDLVVAPVALRSEARRSAPLATFVDEDAEDAPADWQELADLTLGRPELGVRQFLWSYGADVNHPRRAWRGLIDAFRWVHPDPMTGRPSAADAVAAMGTTFPTRADAHRLKVDLLGNVGASVFGVSDLLNALGTSDVSEAFDREALKLEDRARALFENERDAAYELILQLSTQHLNPMGERIFTALCEGGGPSVAMDLERLKPGILPLLVTRNPALARSASLWSVPIDRQRELLDVLGAAGPENVSACVPAMIRAGTSELAADVMRILDTNVVLDIFGAIDPEAGLGRPLLGEGWKAALARNPKAVVDWLKGAHPSVDQFALALSVLEPLDAAVNSVPLTVWIDVATPMLDRMEADLRLRGCAFLLTLGLKARGPEGGSLIAMTYDAVFQAARRDSLPSGMWRWCEEDLPSLNWWRPWDRCERLSLGLLRRFSRGDWAIQDLAEAARDPEAFRRVVSICRDAPGGREFLARLRDADEHGRLKLSAEQKKALRR